MSTSLQWEAPAAGIRLFLSKATITGSSFAAGSMRNLLPCSAPISLRNKLRSIRLVWVTVMALQILLNDKYKLNHCKEMGAEPGRRFLIQPAAKLEPVIVAFDEKRRIPAAGASH